MGIYYKIANLDKHEYIDPDAAAQFLNGKTIKRNGALETLACLDHVKTSGWLPQGRLTPYLLMHMLISDWAYCRIQICGDAGESGPWEIEGEVEWKDVTEEACQAFLDYEED